MQSHDTRLDLYRYFIREECYALWKIDNYAWYCYFGPSPLSRGMMPLSQANLLGNIISVADTSLASEGRCRATLRFGHEVCVMPLACLMQLSSSDKDNAKSQAVANCGFSSFSPDSVETYWRNYNIFPMCSNVQLVFYKNKKKPELPILVKVLLNEREATLPLATETQPYYPWDKVKKFYREYLADKGIKADFGKQTDIF